MIELEFKTIKVNGSGLNLLDTYCPFPIIQKDTFIYSRNCRFCYRYIGKNKGKNSILCSMDDLYDGYPKSKLLLTEKNVLVSKDDIDIDVRYTIIG